jgi:hypothetical protein
VGGNFLNAVLVTTFRPANSFEEISRYGTAERAVLQRRTKNPSPWVAFCASFMISGKRWKSFDADSQRGMCVQAGFREKIGGPASFPETGSSARLWDQLREYFDVRFRAEKYGVPYFLAESEATHGKRPK